MILVFDFDDTLVPELDFNLSGLRAVGAHVEVEYKLEGFTEQLIRKFKAGRNPRLFNECLLELGREDLMEYIADWVNLYRTHPCELHPYADAAKFLSEVHSQHRLALITDGPALMQLNKINSFGMKKLFSKIVVTDELGRQFWKPSERPYQEVQNAFQDERSFVYFGDNPQKDFLAPNRLGWRTVHINRAGGDFSHLSSEYLAHLTARCFDLSLLGHL
jgi:putative hydrolase of the HAD superfamily